MIALTRLNGTDIWLNPLLIESMERTPDSIVTLTNGHKYLVKESPEEVTKMITAFFTSIGLVRGVFGKEEGE